MNNCHLFQSYNLINSQIYFNYYKYKNQPLNYYEKMSPIKLLSVGENLLAT